VVILERAEPLAVRRLVAFGDAVLRGRVEVEGVAAVRVEAAGQEEAGVLPVLVDPQGRCLSALRPQVLVDARMAKAPLDTRREQAPLVIGLGPGFHAGRDVHAVVETQRGPDLGRVIWDGPAVADTSEPAPVLGHTHGRVLRAPRAGAFRAGAARLGDTVAVGQVVGEVDGEVVVVAIGGLLRGLLADGVRVEAGTKLGDVDPRGLPADRISDKARAVAGGVLEAVAVGLRGGGLRPGRGSSIFMAD
jgi:xanthine dehydrogenase accessory factor